MRKSCNGVIRFTEIESYVRLLNIHDTEQFTLVIEYLDSKYLDIIETRKSNQNTVKNDK